MCARRFLGCIFLLVLLAVAGAFAMYQFGDRVLVRMATPTGHFEAPRGDGPDYSEEDNWLAKPGVGQELTGWRPQQADGSGTAPLASAKTAATFYIHPTTYLANDRWNGPIGSEGQVEDRNRLFAKTQPTAFADVSEIWVPRYRQAAFGAFLLDSKDASSALALAYSDVLAAFDHFLAQQPTNRPVILAGHSQGSLHLLHLLADRKDALRGRLVVAYVVGWPVDAKADLPAMGIPACANPSQTGCLMSWQSFRDPANTELVERAWAGKPGLTGEPHRKDNMICTNPLSGGSPSAPASANAGTLVPDGDLSSATLQRGLIGAECRGGYLIITGEPPTIGNFVLPGNNYHAYDYALWWGSIRDDASRRLAAWTAR